MCSIDFWKTKFHNIFQVSLHYTVSEAWLYMHYINLHSDSISNYVIIYIYSLNNLTKFGVEAISLES